MSLFSELKKFGKKIDREISRVVDKSIKESIRPVKKTFAELTRFGKTLDEESRRVNKQFQTAAGLRQEMPDMPAPTGTEPTPDISAFSMYDAARQRRRRTSSYQDTIVAGDLSPKKGKSLLG